MDGWRNIAPPTIKATFCSPRAIRTAASWIRRIGVSPPMRRLFAVLNGARVPETSGGAGFLFAALLIALRGALGVRDERAERVAAYALAGATLSTELDLPAEAEEIRAAVRADLAGIAELDEDDQLIALGDGGWNLPHLPAPYGRSAGPLAAGLPVSAM